MIAVTTLLLISLEFCSGKIGDSYDNIRGVIEEVPLSSVAPGVKNSSTWAEVFDITPGVAEDTPDIESTAIEDADGNVVYHTTVRIAYKDPLTVPDSESENEDQTEVVTDPDSNTESGSVPLPDDDTDTSISTHNDPVVPDSDDSIPEAEVEVTDDKDPEGPDPEPEKRNMTDFFPNPPAFAISRLH